MSAQFRDLGLDVVNALLRLIQTGEALALLAQVGDLLRKTLDNPEAKALSDKYSEIQKELDAIKAEQDGV
jgi:hypothetical protein